MNPLMKPLIKHLSLLSSACLLAACGGGGTDTTASTSSGTTTSVVTTPVTTTTATTTTTTPTPTTTATGSSLNAVYKTVKWQTGVTVTFPTDCSMTYTSNGSPSHALDTYYLEPVRDIGGTAIAYAKFSNMALNYTTYAASTKSMSFTFNTCPAKASTATVTSGGPVGWMISGSSMFNATEGQTNGPAALTDNVSYTIPSGSGAGQTAKFIDSCNGHPTPLSGTYHYHGVPACVTSIVDMAAGASHIIGVALDGFPIYGGRDASGAVVNVSQLDACNGITSATPEFPNGIYHYVLPEGVTSFRSSLGCLSGAVSPRLAIAVLENGICYGSRTFAPVVKSQRQRIAANGRSELVTASLFL